MKTTIIANGKEFKDVVWNEKFYGNAIYLNNTKHILTSDERKALERKLENKNDVANFELAKIGKTAYKSYKSDVRFYVDNKEMNMTLQEVVDYVAKTLVEQDRAERLQIVEERKAERAAKEMTEAEKAKIAIRAMYDYADKHNVSLDRAFQDVFE